MITYKELVIEKKTDPKISEITIKKFVKLGKTSNNLTEQGMNIDHEDNTISLKSTGGSKNISRLDVADFTKMARIKEIDYLLAMG